MGEHDVDKRASDEALRAFTTALLQDVRALERMLDDGLIETGARRVGAEQEMFLVNDGFRPAPKAMEALEIIDDPRFTTELARFNLEANLPVYEFQGSFLRDMEAELRELLEGALEKIEPIGAKILLTGILPTLRLSDLGLDNMCPIPRYFALNEAMVKMRGDGFETRIKGIDDLYAQHDNVMLESCNTSFQLHFQTNPDEFAFLYNVAQFITPPLLAAAVNSPLLLGKRLWHETRVALFEQSVDSRSEAHQIRGGRSRVSFGDGWLRNSVLEIFRDDIARFRSVLATDVGESSLDMLDRGEVPPLNALRIHNGTVYRWNRACYGVHGGKAHLRIENRVLPAGPTIVDEMANAAFFFGLMAGGADAFPDIAERMPFEKVQANFVAAARLGMKAQFSWLDGREVPADELILTELIPLARQGLLSHGIDSEDVDRYLGVLEARVESGQTGAQWAFDSLASLGTTGTSDERMRALTAATHSRQISSEPVHTWSIAENQQPLDWRPSFETVDQFMTTDVYTVRPSDIVDLAANMMDWERIRHIPVESDEGHLVGLLSHRTLVRLLAKGYGKGEHGPVVIEDVMKANPITIPPGTRTVDAMDIMREKRIGCLPIVEKDRLVGLITEHDLVRIAAAVLDQHLREEPSS